MNFVLESMGRTVAFTSNVPPSISPVAVTREDGSNSPMFTCSVGPAGLLYKQFESVADAVSCGGIILFDALDPMKWVFYVGSTLEKALTNGLIGKVTCLDDTLPLKFQVRDDLRGEVFAVSSDTTTNSNHQGQRVYLQRTVSGGEFYPRYTNKEYFAVGTQLVAFTIITGADEGHGFSHGFDSSKIVDWYGHSHKASGALSYMVSEVKSQETFGALAKRSRVAFNSTFEGEIKSYYEDLFFKALTDCGCENEKYSFRIPSFWEGATPVDAGPFYPTTFTPYDSSAPRFDITLDINGAGMLMATSAWKCAEPGSQYGHPESEVDYDSRLYTAAGLNGNLALNKPLLYQDKIISNVEWYSVTWYASVLPRYRVRLYPGSPSHPDDPQPLLPFLVMHGPATMTIPPATKWEGVVEGFQYGALRDAHMIGRSLAKDPLRPLYASRNGPKETVAKMTAQLVLNDPHRVSDEELEPNAEDITNRLAKAMWSVSLKGQSLGPCDPGTLVTYLERFQDVWDTLVIAKINEG